MCYNTKLKLYMIPTASAVRAWERVAPFVNRHFLAINGICVDEFLPYGSRNKFEEP